MKIHLFVVLSWLAMAQPVMADGVLNFTFTVNTPTCAVDVSSSGLIDFGSAMNPHEISKEDSAGDYVKPFSLAINGCGGIFVGGKVPTLTVTGATISDDIAHLAPGASGNNLTKLFADTSVVGYATNVGFSICLNAGSHHCPEGANPPANLFANAVAGNEQISLAAAGDDMPSSIAGWAQITQGQISNPVGSGKMHAVLTFTASYE